YACYGQGDIPGALILLADEVEWHVAGPSEILPWAGRRFGREEVARFLTILPEFLDIQQFEPKEFIAQGDKVVVLGRQLARVKANNRACETDWAMVFTLRNGKISRLREFNDSAAWVAAYAANLRSG